MFDNTNFEKNKNNMLAGKKIHQIKENVKTYMSRSKLFSSTLQSLIN
jgi:hypothetical protein